MNTPRPPFSHPEPDPLAMTPAEEQVAHELARIGSIPFREALDYAHLAQSEFHLEPMQEESE